LGEDSAGLVNYISLWQQKDLCVIEIETSGWKNTKRHCANNTTQLQKKMNLTENDFLSWDLRENPEMLLSKVFLPPSLDLCKKINKGGMLRNRGALSVIG